MQPGLEVALSQLTTAPTAGASTTYTGPFKVTYNGTVTVKFHSVDKAGNIESNKSITFTD